MLAPAHPSQRSRLALARPDQYNLPVASPGRCIDLCITDPTPEV